MTSLHATPTKLAGSQLPGGSAILPKRDFFGPLPLVGHWEPEASACPAAKEWSLRFKVDPLYWNLAVSSVLWKQSQFSYMKIKPQRRPHINLCSLNKTICLGLSVWLDYRKPIYSLENHPNYQSYLSHKPWLMTSVNAGWALKGVQSGTTAELLITSVKLSYTSSFVHKKENRHYLLRCVVQSTCGKGKKSQCAWQRQSFVEATGQR